MEDSSDSFLRMIRRAQRGRLKVFLGYCAGVGKTYQMLVEAHRLRAEGFDVVVGCIETYQRPDIEHLLEGLEVMPRRTVDFRGLSVAEMDLDAILARKPRIVLVDELAHTNVPGSRNAKRYQDAQDLLAAGIHVITTLNIQHLESLYDLVEQVAGIKVRERLPDNILSAADELVNVDLTTEDLLRRLREGKIFPLDQIPVALQPVFTVPNLEQLRELTLRELAAQIDLRRRDPVADGPAAAPDQVMVCLSSRGPSQEKLLRYASRLAGRLNRNWYAVYVQTSAEAPEVVDRSTREALTQTLGVARQLGAMVFTYKGEDVVATLLHFAQEYRVGHIVLGNSVALPTWHRLAGRRTLVERLLAEGHGQTLVVLDTRPSEEGEATRVENAPALPAPLSLAELLTPARVILWPQSVARVEVLRQLVTLVCAAAPELAREPVLAAIQAQEAKTPSFFAEGVAMPHAHMPGLKQPQLALGVPHQGVMDGPMSKAVSCVFLVLIPEQDPDLHARLLALASKACQSHRLLKSIASATTPHEVLAALRDWEALG